MLQEVRFMARNVDYGNDDNLVPFNCYKSYVNEKGRLIRDTIVYERIYCKIESVNQSRSNINNVTRAVSFDAVFTTTSPNKLEEDYYIRNTYTGELWRVQNIAKTPIHNGQLENSKRCQYRYTLGCSG